MSAPPAFTVVIAAHNEEALVGAAVRSVQMQTRRDWEAVVVDDGSTDRTAERVSAIAAEDSRIRLVTHENRGLSAARNTGIELARSEFVSFLDADDLWLPRYLEMLGAALETEPTAGIAYTEAWAFDLTSRRFRRGSATASSPRSELLSEEPAEVMKMLVRENFIWVATTVRRVALEAAGPFRTELTSAEDIDMWFRILARGYRVVGPIGRQGIKRERADAMSREHLTMNVMLQRVMSLLAEDENAAPEVRAAALRRIRDLERWRLALSGESRLLSARLALRLRLGALGRIVLRPYQWRREPPSDVRAAFPELAR